MNSIYENVTERTSKDNQKNNKRIQEYLENKNNTDNQNYNGDNNNNLNANYNYNYENIVMPDINDLICDQKQFIDDDYLLHLHQRLVQAKEEDKY